MKIVICTTPIRPYPTDFPPFGSMAIIQSLRFAGFDPLFYDIDGLRPDFEEVVEFIRQETPDVLGISAVVSTAYKYTKELALKVKEVSPKTQIVVGGNLAASAELLHRFCEIDFCVIGEGERIFVNLVNYLEAHPDIPDYATLKKIKGITYLDASNDLEFTGYEVAIPASEFMSPDWSILEKSTKIENYFTDPLDQFGFARDPRSYEPHRLGKKYGHINTAKGCVARCTFCHRWDRGYRRWSVDQIIDNIKFLMDEYNVGFIGFADENFGSDRKQVDELIERIKPLDILYRVGGVRVASVDPDLLKRLRDSGCTTMYYGMETGSPDILQVMEKNTVLQKNVDAARWTHEAGLYTIYQLVLGMPGENTSTIADTSRFITEATEFLPDPPHRRLSVNYIQALPGTPAYEYGRNIGLIGGTLEAEEEYLLGVSDVDAADDSKFLNFTNKDYITVQSWRQKIILEAETNWYKQRGWSKSPKETDLMALNSNMPDSEADEDLTVGGYFNRRRMFTRHPFFYRVLDAPIGKPVQLLYPIAFSTAKNFKHLSLRVASKHALEYLIELIKPRKRVILDDAKSLRIVMKERDNVPVTKSEQSMKPLRDGR